MLSESCETFIETILKFLFFLGLLSFVNRKMVMKLDNIIIDSMYENDIDFSKYNTNYKIITLFYPDNYLKQKDISINKLEEDIKLIKNHGIFGFGMIYNFTNNKIYDEFLFNLFSYLNGINFPYFIIFNSYIDSSILNKTSLIQNLTENYIYSSDFINNITKYFKSENYIKYNGKPIIGILDYFYLYHQFIKSIKIQENNNIYIISLTNGHKDLNQTNLFNSTVEFQSQDIGLEHNLNQKYFYNYYNYNLLKKKFIRKDKIINFSIINGCLPEKFYILFKKYLNYISNKEDTFILFNAWNNNFQNSYLEPDEEYGYTHLNYFSKAIFNIKNQDIKYDFTNLTDNCKIVVQIHIFYEDLIEELINKTNNIPSKYDLYITTTSESINTKIKNYVKKHSNANYYEVLTVQNRGRDILPFLTQMRQIYKKYKYMCHIHSKKSQTAPEIGILWRQYLINNLLGDTQLISQILYDFENNNKLGFIFPETFYYIIKHYYILTNDTKKWMEFLLSLFTIDYKLDNELVFPAGNMFWAKIDSIYQMFTFDLEKYFPKEDDQCNDTIMHGIERIWIYLVKLNKFFYKIIFKYF